MSQNVPLAILSKFASVCANPLKKWRGKTEAQAKKAAYAEIHRVWHLGGSQGLKGNHRAAVAGWTEAMRLQKKFAKKFHTASANRFLHGYAWTYGIGHIALLDFFAKLQVLGLSSCRYGIFTTPTAVANQAYLDCWRPWFDLTLDPQKIAAVDSGLFNEEYPGVLSIGNDWWHLHDALPMLEERWDAAGHSPLPSLSAEQIDVGWQTLSRLGVPRDTWFVTLHAREGGYVSGSSETKSARNCMIESYQEAIQLITDSGGWVVRIGGSNFTPLPKQPRVIDYACSDFKSDLLDVFFLSQCKFCIATNSGPAWVAGTFGIPTVLTNWAPLGVFSHYKNTITVPKLLWSNKDNRLLTFAEQLEEPLGYLESESALADLSLTSVSNEQADITQAVSEMLTVPDSSRQMDPADEQRQVAFNKIAAKTGKKMRGRMSLHFLRRHSELLEAKRAN